MSNLPNPSSIGDVLNGLAAARLNADGHKDYLNLHTPYFRHVYENPDKVIDQARYVIGETDYDTMVGMGMSGALIIPLLARAFGKHWLIVRKESERRHDTSPTTGELGHRWIFVDDLIDSGNTRKFVYRTVMNVAARDSFETKYVGAYLYRSYQFIFDHPLESNPYFS